MTFGTVGNRKVVLDGVSPVSAQSHITSTLQNITCDGLTDRGIGIELAYDIAHKHYIQNGNNRIILITDGDFNDGAMSTNDLANYIEQNRETDIHLSILGIGNGNYKDNNLKLLATHSNGNYYYIDSQIEANRVLSTELDSN